MDEVLGSFSGYVATIVAILIAAYLKQRYVEPRSRVLVGSSRQFDVEIKDQGIDLMVNSLIIKNWGLRKAERVEIIHSVRPEFFQLRPSVAYRETTNPNGEHVITIESLGSGDSVILQTASNIRPLNLQSVRSDEGKARWVEISAQHERPRWRRILQKVLIILGAASIFYWLSKAALEIVVLF